MNDFSDSGLFLLTNNCALLPGTIVKIQTTEFPDAPIQTASLVLTLPKMFLSWLLFLMNGCNRFDERQEIVNVGGETQSI